MIIARVLTALRKTADHCGLVGLISRVPMAGWINSIYLHSARGGIAGRHLHGYGIEIGALHMPLRVRKDVRVKYVDRLPYEELVRDHPELKRSKITKPDIIDDGFSLSSIAEHSQDFVIANHVLEHTPDPIRALLNWSRVLRRGGVLFVTVPKLSNWMDKGREVTSVAHMIEDYSCDAIRLRERNRSHYIEWYKIGIPNYCNSVGKPVPSISMEEYIAEGANIHFHTFSKESISELIRYFCTDINASVKLEDLCDVGGEIIFVLKNVTTDRNGLPVTS